jgi:hypothetical protein
MRTLGTQVRLRRLLRQHGEALDRLRAAPGDLEAAAAARRRLGDLVNDVRDAWSADVSAVRLPVAATELPVFDSHVRRSLRALEGTVAEYDRAPSDDRLQWLAAQFHAAAIPLLLFLRGLEETPDELLEGWLAPVLAKSA